MIKILLIGAQGQLATEFIQQAKHYPVLLFSYNRKQLDITDVKAVRLAVETIKPDWIINTAAYTAVDLAEIQSQQAYAVNSIAVENLAKVAEHFAIPILHVSTDYVFSGEQLQPYNEQDICKPINIYGQSKLAGEQRLAENCEKHIILRSSWLYGRYGHNFMKTISHKARQGETLSIVADQIGCPTATTDLANAIMHIILFKKHQWGIYHCCNQGSASWYDFAKAIVEIDSQQNNYLPPKINAVDSSFFDVVAKRPQNSVLNCEKIESVFDIVLPLWQQALINTMKPETEDVISGVINECRKK